MDSADSALAVVDWVTARVGVVAHRRETLGGGLGELRRRLREHGVTQPLWYEVVPAAITVGVPVGG